MKVLIQALPELANEYVKSVQMEWAQNSDSETPVKKHNRTSGTD